MWLWDLLRSESIMIVKKIKIKEHQMCRPHTELSIIKSISPYLQHNLFSPVLSRIAAVGFDCRCWWRPKSSHLLVEEETGTKSALSESGWDMSPASSLLIRPVGPMVVHRKWRDFASLTLVPCPVNACVFPWPQLNTSFPLKICCWQTQTEITLMTSSGICHKRFSTLYSFRRLGSFPCDHKLSFMFQMLTLHPE